MKELFSVEKEIGTDGAKGKAAIGVEGEMLTVEVKAQMPIQKVVEPVMKVADQFVDKIEALIPGDQKAMAEAAKADFRAAIVKQLTEGIG